MSRGRSLERCSRDTFVGISWSCEKVRVDSMKADGALSVSRVCARVA